MTDGQTGIKHTHILTCRNIDKKHTRIKTLKCNHPSNHTVLIGYSAKLCTDE